MRPMSAEPSFRYPDMDLVLLDLGTADSRWSDVESFEAGRAHGRCVCVDYDENLRVRLVPGQIRHETPEDAEVIEIALDNERPVTVGAPAFAGKFLVGIVASVDASSGIAYAIPSERILRAFVRARNSRKSSTERSGDEIFHTLSRGALSALGWAEALRVACHATRVHTEHLLVGLMENPRSVTAYVLEKAGMSPNRLRTLLASLPETALPNASVNPSELVELERLPELSVHGEEALHARRSCRAREGFAHAPDAPPSLWIALRRQLSRRERAGEGGRAQGDGAARSRPGARLAPPRDPRLPLRSGGGDGPSQSRARGAGALLGDHRRATSSPPSRSACSATGERGRPSS